VNTNGKRAVGQAELLEREWATAERWHGIERSCTGEDVVRLRGTVQVEHTLARLGAERLWRLLHEDEYVAALGAMTGGQAVQMAKAGLRAIYLSGWQVAADANLSGSTYPDQSLYPAKSARPSSAASTTRCSAPTRSRAPGTTSQSTGCCRSSRTPRPGSVAR
jgi:isocitrate lyase